MIRSTLLLVLLLPAGGCGTGSFITEQVHAIQIKHLQDRMLFLEIELVRSTELGRAMLAADGPGATLDLESLQLPGRAKRADKHLYFLVPDSPFFSEARYSLASGYLHEAFTDYMREARVDSGRLVFAQVPAGRYWLAIVSQEENEDGVRHFGHEVAVSVSDGILELRGDVKPHEIPWARPVKKAFSSKRGRLR